MAIGIKRGDLFKGLIKPHEARLCEDCCCVVAAEKCPLCEAATVLHPERDEKPCYCVCGDEIDPGEEKVIPWTHNPYVQDGEGGLSFICPACAREEEETA